MSQHLQGKVAIVTGSGQNVGRAIALELARQGAKVVTNSRSPANKDGTATDTANAIKADGGEATAVFADVSTTAGGEKVIDACLAVYGTIDILVNNAGYGNVSAMPEVTDADWDEMLAVNLTSQFGCIRAALPTMIARKKGRVVNVSSRVALNGTAGMIGYAASKAGVIAMTLVLAREMEKHGITINCIMPTATTPKVEAHRRSRAEKAGATYYPPPPTRQPEHIAPLIAYLVTDEAAKVSGQLFHVSGGDITLFRAPEPRTMLIKQGIWSVDELMKNVPSYFGPDLRLAPPPPPPS